jgi:hypothetical protein
MCEFIFQNKIPYTDIYICLKFIYGKKCRICKLYSNRHIYSFVLNKNKLNRSCTYEIGIWTVYINNGNSF